MRCYKLGNISLEKVHSCKCTNVTSSDDLSWNYRMHKVTSGACQTLGFLRRKVYLASKNVKLIAYRTFIRPHLEYAELMWWPYHTHLINILERIQNKAAHFISYNYLQRSNVAGIKHDLSLASLSKIS